MYLKSLVLKGFKSFADRSALTLEPGITAVVGPNGSGKSNISDAVLWVLGERNAKNLRGQAMEDVIFAGSSARKASGLAEVDLVLDNSDGTLPVDFDEVAITRRMYRNGESEYLINGTVARRMDVLDILHDSGLGTGTHSIISQGSLDSILQSKPEDRRALIEEAAGVLKHKQRKAKSERKLEHMDQHLARVKDVAAEVERQLGPLERKAKRARAYQGLSAELSELTLALAVDDLRVLQAQIAEKQQTLETSLAEQQSAKEALAVKNNELRDQRTEATGLIKEMEENEADYKDVLAEIEAEEEKTQKEIVRLSKELAAQQGNTTVTYGGYIWPVTTSKRVTSPFGKRNTGIKGASTNHRGIDIGGVYYSSTVYAAKAGTVIISSSNSVRGQYIVISHGSGNTTTYQHLSKRSVSVGAVVKQGQAIGVTGSSGVGSGPHLHFEITENGQLVNPLKYLTDYVKAWN